MQVVNVTYYVYRLHTHIRKKWHENLNFSALSCAPIKNSAWKMIWEPTPMAKHSLNVSRLRCDDFPFVMCVFPLFWQVKQQQQQQPEDMFVQNKIVIFCTCCLVLRGRAAFNWTHHKSCIQILFLLFQHLVSRAWNMDFAGNLMKFPISILAASKHDRVCSIYI